MRQLRLKSVKKVSNTSERYDIQVRRTHNFFADGMVVHNSFCCIQWIPDLNHPEMFGDSGNIVVGSKGLIKQGLVFKNNANNDGNVYVQILRKLLDQGLERNLAALSHMYSDSVKIFGEVFGGNIQDLKYGLTAPVFRVFDIKIGNSFEPRSVAESICDSMGLEMLPVLYSGPFDLAEIEKVRDGKTAISGDNIREGVVVTSRDTSVHPVHGRRIAKFISPAYLTRSNKNATEYQ